jgi:carboxymethylenebutenolidase
MPTTGEKVKILKRLLLTLLILIAALILFLAASNAIDAAFGRERIDALANTTIPGQNGGPDVRAYVAAPPGDGPFPVVIMIHEFYGLNESILSKAEGLAEEGYLVVAPDTFRGATTQWIPRAIYQVITSNPAEVRQDLDSVYAWIESLPGAASDRVGILGFCYGGRVSLNYSLHNNRLASTVIFYGSPETDPEVLRSLPAPVLGIFGGADRSIPVEEVQAFDAALDQAGIPNEITIYEGQPHAFMTDMESIRLGGVQGEAWAQMLAFLSRNLQPSDASTRPGTVVAHKEPFNWRYYLILAYEHAFTKTGHPH